ncbi:MAG: alpha-amylase family glycosyl hydrolase [Ruminococcus bromii]|nr:alpha-amylase family glycosyl hydrolase [Ruminococcus bromii]HCB96410.1 glycosidase [Ruminococcus sp.]
MAHFKKVIALILTLCVVCTAGIISVNAANIDDDSDTSASSGITVHYYSESGTPYVYYWNSLPQNIETQYPGKAMIAEGNGYYKYTFDNVTKINLMFVVNGKQSKELTRKTGEWWYKDGRWSSTNTPYDRADLREDSIYFIITTRFYDGDTGNNVHCWADGEANNPDSDPAWRGDFKGLIEKMDYIKALGFSAIWITPVVTNASGYDYHGYHAFDFSTVDVRYESDDTTYQDVIDAAHAKGLKIIQDVVWNHSGNFGEKTLCEMFTKEYNSVQDLASTDSMKVIEGSELDKAYPNYDSMNGDAQFQARLDIMKDLKNNGHDKQETYHRERNMGYGTELEQQGSMAGDCVDINTENPVVANYITDTYLDYANMGVDAFRLDTEKHINRWTLNSAYFPKFKNIKNFYIFGEVCARWSEFINEGGASDSPFFFTWAETESAWKNNWGTNFSDWNINNENSKKHYQTHMFKSTDQLEKSNNVYLNGLTYHTPDYSKSNGTGVIDFTMHWNFENASSAFGTALGEDPYFNDSTWNVTYVDSHDYAPNSCQYVRYNYGTQAWAENMDLMFTFRGIPCIYYGSEIEFQKGQKIDDGTNIPLSKSGRAYYGDNIEGTVTASDFGKYTASGKVKETLSSPLSVHLQQLNLIRRAVPALQKGQYTTSSNYVDGNMAFVRRYTANGTDSLACVAISGGATFKNLPNGKYIDAVTGDVKNVTNGTLTVPSMGTANMRVYVCCAPGFTGINGKIGTNGTYLK